MAEGERCVNVKLEERDAETPLPLFGTSPRDRKLQAATTKADAQAQLDLPLPSQKPSLRSKTKFNVYATVPPFLSNEQFTAIVREISKLASLRERQAFITPYASQYYFICDQLGQLFQVLQFPTEKRGVVEILGPRLWDMETKLAEMVRRYMVWETEEERAWILGPLIEGKQR
ncbi:hypothetical protein BC938DRAFT_484027 [Jimgerdemannia flammicorona]|uniref:DUF4476 domain-containing protein n=1 Tax=Jimgerdemannia flammicorona TaxID=994334 RepID=A0A433QAP4_9FUNG|nr:hypothetical protein BC938DRAFT_484027 [Jimgerdemannia flammicorona]